MMSGYFVIILNDFNVGILYGFDGFFFRSRCFIVSFRMFLMYFFVEVYMLEMNVKNGEWCLFIEGLKFWCKLKMICKYSSAFFSFFDVNGFKVKFNSFCLYGCRILLNGNLFKIL